MTPSFLDGLNDEQREAVTLPHQSALILAGAVCAVALLLARWLGKSPERQIVMLLGLVVFTIGAAHMLRLSVLFALLVLGLLLRNLDTRHDVMAVDLGRAEQLFFVVLFVVTGARIALRRSLEKVSVITATNL